MWFRLRSGVQKTPLSLVQRISSSVVDVLRLSVHARTVVLREAEIGGMDISTLITDLSGMKCRSLLCEPTVKC